MKGFLKFAVGVFVGLLISAFFVKTPSNEVDKEERSRESIDTVEVDNSQMQGLTLFDEKGDCLASENKKMKVDKVLSKGVAIANLKNQQIGEYEFYDGLKMLLIDRDGKHFYDDQIIKIPKGCCARQIGVYKYYSETLPVVEISK